MRKYSRFKQTSIGRWDMKNNLKHIVFFARLVFNKSRAYIIMSFLFAMIQAVQPFVLIFLPMIVIDLLLVQRAWRDIVIVVVAGGLIWLILGLCANALEIGCQY